MIFKSYELSKIKERKFSLFLFYGKNEGLKNEAINNLIKDNNTTNYEEREILDNQNNYI